MNKGDLLDDAENLLRRVYRKDKKYINPKTGKPTSRAFAPRPRDSGKLSVDVERLTNLEDSIIDGIRFKLFRITAGLAHSLGLKCFYDPLILSEDGCENPAHSLICGFVDEDESIPGILARKADPIEFP